MNNFDKKKVKRHIDLTLVVFTVIFCIILAVEVIAIGMLLLLVKSGIISVGWVGGTNVERVGLLMLIISVALSIVIVLWAERIPVKLIRYLITQINRLASGDFSVRLDFGPLIKGPSFRELSDSFNKMAEELGGTQLLRNDFINNFSHEFKTPIVSIAGFAKVLKRGNLSPEQQREYLDIIEAESMRLSYMATNVLNLTRVENQTILTDVSQFNLSEQIRSCVLLLEHKWSKKDIDWRINFTEHTISANEELLKQVWINLLDNAVKFSSSGGTIEVGISEHTNYLRVSVINSGDEIPEEVRDRIFRKFYQADESHAGEGNGIGLAIVKCVVELHNGRVGVTSENGLNIFTVDLPNTQ